MNSKMSDPHESDPDGDDLPHQLDNPWELIKRGGVRIVRCITCGFECFEGDAARSEAHEREHTNPNVGR